MKPGVILTAREAETVQERLTAIGRLSSDRRIKEQCRLVQVAIYSGGRRATRFQKDQDALLRTIKETLNPHAL